MQGRRSIQILTFIWQSMPNAALFAATFNPPASSGFLSSLRSRNSTNFTAKSSRRGSTFELGLQFHRLLVPIALRAE